MIVRGCVRGVGRAGAAEWVLVADFIEGGVGEELVLVGVGAEERLDFVAQAEIVAASAAEEDGALCVGELSGFEEDIASGPLHGFGSDVGRACPVWCTSRAGALFAIFCILSGGAACHNRGDIEGAISGGGRWGNHLCGLAWNLVEAAWWGWVNRTVRNGDVAVELTVAAGFQRC